MRFWYDTEFIEDGRTIDLISIGIVAEDGAEYYAVNLDAPWKRIYRHEWLNEHVVPSLPRYYGDARNIHGGGVNFDDPTCRTYAKIRADVKAFLLGPFDVPRDVELWAWYGAYDHVALAQLFGPMVNLPDGIPMWTNDLRQEVHRLGIDPDSLPTQRTGLHNAIEDARHLRTMFNHVSALPATSPVERGPAHDPPPGRS